MRNVVHSNALERRSRRLLEIAAIATPAGLFFGVVGLALFVVPLVSSGSAVYTLFALGRALLTGVGVILGVSGVGMILRAFTWKTENDLARQTGEVLAPHLDDRYTFIRNVSKRKIGYIDAVLVGPPGILVLRVVDYEGRFLNEAGRWLVANKKGKWSPYSSNPTKEVVADIKNLRTYLVERQLPDDIPIFGVVVFVKDDPIAHLTIKDPMILATHLASLPMRLQGNYLAKERIPPKAVAAIVRLLYGE
jgi:hypothetical protein